MKNLFANADGGKANSGQGLRAIREQLGLTMRDVEAASLRIAERHQNFDFAIPRSRLSDFEARGVMPSAQRLYTFSVIYGRDIRELWAMYDMDLAEVAGDLECVELAASHRIQTLDYPPILRSVPILDPGFALRDTANFGRMILDWGVVPTAFLERLADREYTYGYIGTEDLTMYPLLLPGSFVQVDESRHDVTAGPWRTEYERPIYFIETRDGWTACWCSLSSNREELILQPHPLSPNPMPRTMSHPQEAEIIGQVVGVAMRLDLWHKGLLTAEEESESIARGANNPRGSQETSRSRTT